VKFKYGLKSEYDISLFSFVLTFSQVPFGIHLRQTDIGPGTKLRVGDPVKVIA